jgi:hypothetical protein
VRKSVLTPCEVILAFHFHLGVLILVDTLESQPKVATVDTLIDIGTCRLASTRAIVNLINLMLLQGASDAVNDTTTVSIFLKDPYPEHTRNGLSRAAHSVLSLFHSMSITKQVAESMAAPIFATLEILCQVSYTAAESLHGLYKTYSEADLTAMRLRTGLSTYLAAAPPDLDPSITPEMFDDETVRQLDLAEEDPHLVEKTIGRHETHDLSYDFDWFDLEGIDFSSVTNEWAFQVRNPSQWQR